LFIPYKLKEENQMRTEIQVFTSEKFGQLRTSEIDGVIWFCGIDVAKALGYTNPRDAYKRHCKSKGGRETLHPYGWWKARNGLS
jgi:prophage antirepressor-like protein